MSEAESEPVPVVALVSEDPQPDFLDLLNEPCDVSNLICEEQLCDETILNDADTSEGCDEVVSDAPLTLEDHPCTSPIIPNEPRDVDTPSNEISRKTEDSECDKSPMESSSLEDNNSNNSDSMHSSKTNRDLRSILELAKEAKLDTNIASLRRKTQELNKASPTFGVSGKKPRSTSFPVTAESELANMKGEADDKKERFDKIGVKKKKKSLDENAQEGASENESFRRSLGCEQGDFVMARKSGKDPFCWRCHHDSVQIACETCPRSYHFKCLKQSSISDKNHWPCPECVAILRAENTQTRSDAMKNMTLEHLCSLLKYAMRRMVQCDGFEPFVHPVDEKQFPEYRDYIVQPMTLTMLRDNIRNNLYGSTQAFEADAKWIAHNSIIFNSCQSKLTTTAKAIVKICKQEMSEIENCSTCYLNANTEIKKHTWFVEVCPKPHILVWAKLKGFPYWPAKVMSVNSSGLVDVRFFGAHDRAWVNVRDCYLYSVKDPNKGLKRNDIAECVKELDLYVENLKKVFRRVVLAPFKTPLDIENMQKQLEMLLPKYATSVKPNKDLMEICDKSEEKHSDSEDKDKNGATVEEAVTEPPKIKPKPIKTIIIRKRYSADNVVEHSIKLARNEKNELNPKGTSEEPKKKDTIKITDQLIQKLESPEKEKQSDKKTGEVSTVDKKIVEEIKENGDSHKVDSSAVEIDTGVTKTDTSPDSEVINGEPVPKSTEIVVKKAIKRKPEETLEAVPKKATFPPNKMVKLVPIENILQKRDQPDLIVVKGLRVVKRGNVDDKSEKTGKKDTPPETPMDITTVKHEIESDEDNEVQYMEAKRQLLSALNISEKNNVPLKPKSKEIRTRSKTENKSLLIKNNVSKERSKSCDNSSACGSSDEAPKNQSAPSEATTTTPSTAPNKDIVVKNVNLGAKHRARKSFPIPNYSSSKKPMLARKIVPKPPDGMEELKFVNASTIQTLTTQSGNVVILPKLHYNKSAFIGTPRELSSPPLLTMLPRPNADAKKAKVAESQNYIPQNEEISTASTSTGSNNAPGSVLLNNLITGGGVTTTVIPTGVDLETQQQQLDAELGILKEILPETVSKGVSEILCQPPPKLKPKPSGILETIIESSSSTTPVTGPAGALINSMSQKLSDCFREILVETINDLGKNNSPEAIITGLRLEIEELNHKHSIELSEIRRNVSIVLKDIQKSIIEERDRIVNETKANCELEMLKKVEETKSKQWCVNCGKEAQFYCCWNTSYCDYPCQQKHWLKHMTKCTQSAPQNPQTTAPRVSAQQPIVLTQTTPKFAFNRTTQKVYLKRTPMKSSSGGGRITLVESAPGNFELVGSGPIAVNGKILATTSVIEKIKSGNIVTVQAPSGPNSTQITSSTQKVNTTNNISTSSAALPVSTTNRPSCSVSDSEH